MPLNELDETSSGNAANEYVKFIVENSMPGNCALLLSEVREETAKDKTLTKIMNLVHSGAWSEDADIKPFEPFREEFSVYDGILLCGDGIVVPASLQKRILMHETHVGIVRTKQLLRSRYFWVGMDKALMSYRSIPHPMTGKMPASLLFHREIRTELPSVKSKVSRSSSEVTERVKLYQKRMKSYHDSKHRAKAHSFTIGDIVYLAQTRFDGTNKLKYKFDTVKYVIIDFLGRDTCKVVSTLDGKVYIRNVKFLTRGPILGQALIFDDIDDRENSPKFNICRTDDSAKDSVIRTRSGRVSKPTRFKDFVYY